MPRPSVSKRRAPDGVVTDKPLYVRLLPAERDRLKACAETEGRSLGNMGRHLILQALHLRQQQPTLAAEQLPATLVVEG